MKISLSRIIRGFFLATLLSSITFVSPVFAATSNTAASKSVFKESISTLDIREKFEKASSTKSKTEKVKILIVPGHDDKYAGALFGDIREADLTLRLGKELHALLKKEKGVETTLLRTEKGYDPHFSNYITKNLKSILKFRESKQTTMQKLILEGKVQDYSNVSHNNALPSVATILYGINKYANDNEYDIVLHIHFNDYPGHGALPGTYTGFTIYVPEKQFGNAKASQDLAKKVRDQLSLVSAESSHPQEDGITPDQELIGIGAYNTLSAAVILTEYGYVYEPQFIDPAIAPTVITELARQTYVGVMNYLKNTKIVKTTYPTLEGYVWKKELSTNSGLDILALQDLLYEWELYPNEESLNTCQLHGQYNRCITNGIRKFQKENKLKVTGLFNKATRAAVNQLAK